LPVPRRAPRDVPEVQVLVLEEVDRYVRTSPGLIQAITDLF
jgi:hypothetical protein